MNAFLRPGSSRTRDTASATTTIMDIDLPAGVRAMHSETLLTLRLALELYQQPQRAAALRHAALPNAEFDLLLHCAAGAAELQEVAAVLRTPPQTLQAALDFYLVQVLFVPAASAWRVLGLHAGADARQVREHARLMLLWLARTRARNPLVTLHIAQVRRAQHALRQESQTGEHTVRMPAPALQPRRVQQARAALRPTTHAGMRALRLLALALIGMALALGLLWLSRQWHAAPPRITAVTLAPSLAWPAALPVAPPRMHIAMPALARGISLPAMRLQAAPMPQPLTMLVPKAAIFTPLAVAWLPLRQSPAIPARGTQVRVAPLRMPRPALPSLRLPIRSAAMPMPQPASVPPIATASPAPAANTTAIVSVLRAFSDSYARGDLPAFMALFAPQVRDGARDFAALRETYARLFAGSAARSLHLSEVRIAPVDTTRARVLLHYEARVLEYGAATSALYRGALALDMQSAHGTWRIVGLRRVAAPATATAVAASAARSE